MSRRAPASPTRLLTVIGGEEITAKKQSLSATICKGQPQPAGTGGIGQGLCPHPSSFPQALQEIQSSSKVAFQQLFGNFTLTQKALVTLRKN